MSAITPFQPTLPPEAAFTDAEVSFIEESPPTLFPENQNSNFGTVIRKTFTDRVQTLIGQLDTLYSERFVKSSTQFLDEWERQAGVPTAPSGFDVATRQAIVLGRVRKGPFTRTRRRDVVEKYITATFGTPVSFDSAGVPLNASGTPLYAEASSVTSLYEIVENIPGFSYTVYILNTLTVSDGLQRELARITPAHISFSIQYVATLP